MNEPRLAPGRDRAVGRPVTRARRGRRAVAHGPEWSASLRRAPDAQLRAWLELALDCADEADEIALRFFRRDPAVMRKPDRTLVTEADHEIEERVRSRIGVAFPDHGLVGEELGVERASAIARWFIDPIDGTHNFVRGIPIFASLLALEMEGEVQLGVVSAPALRERWFAWRGGGAWRGRRTDDPLAIRLHASRISLVADAQVLYSSVDSITRDGRAPGFADLIASAWRDRGFGDFWGHVLVAEGAAEAMLEVGLSPWDLAAPLVIVEEAGGVVTDFAGERVLGGPTTLTSNGILHDQILERLQAPGRPRADGGSLAIDNRPTRIRAQRPG